MSPCLYCQNSSRFSPRGLDLTVSGESFDPDYAEHMETVHNTVVRRPGETDVQAAARLEDRMIAFAQSDAAVLIAAADAKAVDPSAPPKKRGRPRKVAVEA